jgi:nucleotide-binding universal stress UspA family protein
MRLSLGSVTDSLIRDTTIPVLVVKPRASYLTPGAEELFRRIVVPLDGSSLAEQILSEVVTLAKLDVARLTLLRILVPGNPAKTGSADHEPRWWDRDLAAAQAYLYRTAARLREQGCLTTTHIAINENVPQAIADYAREVRADLVALATHGRGGISRALRGSVADVVTRTAPASLLLFRPVGAFTEEFAASVARLPDGIPVIA